MRVYTIDDDLRLRRFTGPPTLTCMLRWGLPSPRFEAVDRNVRVTLPGPAGGPGQLTQRQRRVLEMVGEKGEISSADVRREFAISPMTAAKDLRGLVDTGRLRIAGKGRATRYLLP